MRWVVAIGTLMFLFASTCLVQAKPGKKARPDGVRGVITNVDDAAKSFTFHTGRKKAGNVAEITILFDAKTKFVKLSESGSADAKREDLVGKKRAAVVYDTKDGKSVATKITIIDLPRKKKKQ